MAHDVFISYATADQTVALMVCATLEKQGIRCWMAPRDVQPGDDWARAIVAAIKASRAMVLVFSGAANDSHHIPREIERAIGREIPVVPVRIENVEPSGSLEYSLSSVHWLDAISPPVEAHIIKLADRLRTMIQGPAETGSAPAVAPPTPPPLGVPIPQPEPVRPAPTVPAPAVPAPRSRQGLVVTGAVIATAVLVYVLANRPPAPATTPAPATPSPTAAPSPTLPPSPLPTASPLPTVSPSPSPKATPKPPSTAGASGETLNVDRNLRLYPFPAHNPGALTLDSQDVADMRRAADVYRRDPRPAIDLGNAYYDARRFDSAIPWYIEALHRAPGNADVLVDLAMLYWSAKRDADALSHLRDALAAEPRNVTALLNLGIYYVLRERLDLAAESWRRVIQAQPGSYAAIRARDMLTKIGAR